MLTVRHLLWAIAVSAVSAQAADCFAENAPYIRIASEPLKALTEALDNIQRKVSFLGTDDKTRMARLSVKLDVLSREKSEYIKKLTAFASDEMKAADLNRATYEMMDLVQQNIRELTSVGERGTGLAANDAFEPLYRALAALRDAKGNLCEVKGTGKEHREEVNRLVDDLTREIEMLKQNRRKLSAILSK